MSPVGLRSHKSCAGDAKTENYRSNFSSERAAHINKPETVKKNKNNERENGKKWSRVTDGCLTPRRTVQQTVGRNITLTLTSRNVLIFLKFTLHQSRNYTVILVNLPWSADRSPNNPTESRQAYYFLTTIMKVFRCTKTCRKV
jgi:hypothetical protein